MVTAAQLAALEELEELDREFPAQAAVVDKPGLIVWLNDRTHDLGAYIDAYCAADCIDGFRWVLPAPPARRWFSW